MPKLFVLDVILPGSEGFDVCRAIREVSSLARVPIIFFVLTARGGEQDRIRGLEIGADDYLSKPFSPRELVARVKTVLRRYSRLRSLPIRVGDVELDARALTLTVRGKEHPTTITELRLLDRFIRNIGHVLSRQELVDYVWEETNDVNTHAVDVHVQHSREDRRRSCQPSLFKDSSRPGLSVRWAPSVSALLKQWRGAESTTSRRHAAISQHRKRIPVNPRSGRVSSSSSILG